jgi:hypothetical protein
MDLCFEYIILVKRGKNNEKYKAVRGMPGFRINMVFQAANYL